MDKLHNPLFKSWHQGPIRYSNVWEDYKCLISSINALSLQPKTVLSIASSGDNVLNLLLTSPKHLVAIDMNASQIAILELKKIALQKLSFEEFQQLFGYSTAPSLPDDAILLVDDLSKDSRFFWKKNWSLLESRLIHQGQLDQYFKRFRETILQKKISEKEFSELINCTELTKQRDLWLNVFNKLKSNVTEFFSQSSMENVARDAQQFKYVSQKNIGDIFASLFIKKISQTLISENPYLYFFLTGEPLTGPHSLPFLKEENYNLLQKNADHIEIITSDLESYLPDVKTVFDFMNLSDIFEYLSVEQTNKLFALLQTHLHPSGAILYWNLLAHRTPPDSLRLNESLSTQLSQCDQTWFYANFNVVQHSESK